MRKTLGLSAAIVLSAVLATPAVQGQGQAQMPAQPAQPMSFFITSVGVGNGANLGGLAGADKHCQTLAAAAGQGNRTWRAYLSQTQAGQEPAINARDRIGTGPWFNAKGQLVASNVADLHGDQQRDRNNIRKPTALNEKGGMVNGVGDMPNQHDMLTGSDSTGCALIGAAGHTHVRQLDEQRHGQRDAGPSRSSRRRQRVVECGSQLGRLQPGRTGQDRRRGPLLLLRDELNGELSSLQL